MKTIPLLCIAALVLSGCGPASPRYQLTQGTYLEYVGRDPKTTPVLIKIDTISGQSWYLYNPSNGGPPEWRGISN